MSIVHVLSKQSVKSLVSTWLRNEASFNLSGFAHDNAESTLILTMKSLGTIAGVPFIDAVAQELGCTVQWHVQEGNVVTSPNTKVVSISGPTEELIHGEQLFRAILSRACGIATFASRLKKLLKDFLWKGELVSPSTNTPGFSLVEEYAMLVGGVPSTKSTSVHLQASQLSKSANSKEAVNAIRARVGKTSQIKVECNTLQEAKNAIEAGANIVLFDGMNAKDLGTFSSQLKSSFANILVEASGNFDDTTLRPFALQNIDYLTTKKLCNGYPVVDFRASYVPFEGSAAQAVISTQKRSAVSEASSLSAETSDTIKVNDGIEQEDVKRARTDDTKPGASAGEVVKKDSENQSKDDQSKVTPSALAAAIGNDSNTPTKIGGQANGNRYYPRQQRQQRNQGNRSQSLQRGIINTTPTRQQNQNPRSTSVTRRLSDHRSESPPRNLRSHIQQSNGPQMSMGNRMMNPNLGLRSAGGSMLQSNNQSLSLHNAMAMMNSQSNNANAFRVPMQPQHRLSGGSGINQSPFSNSPQPLGSGNSWAMLSSPSAHALRLGNMQGQCRNCGATNAVNAMFCRNCRSPTR